jgi:hypothetical protein
MTLQRGRVVGKYSTEVTFRRSTNYLTPKALANFSPGFELARTLGIDDRKNSTLKGFANRPNPFRVK